MRRLKFVLLVVVLPVALIGGCATMVAVKMRRKADPVKTAKVERGDLVVAVRETGTIEPVRRVEVKSKVAGLLSSLKVEEGDWVEKGQLIAKLDVPELEAQRDQVKAQSDAAGARLDQARLSLDRDRTVIDSQVKQAQANLRGAEASAQEAETRRRDADRIHENMRRLFEMGGYVARNEVDSAKAALDLAVQAQRSAEERVLEQQAAVSAAEARRAEVPLSESRIAEAQASLRQIQDSLAEIETRLRDAVITAPCSGVVIARHVRQGELITAVSYYGSGAPIVTIGDLSKMLAKVNLNEVDIAKVHVGQSVKITVDALRGRTQEGRVTRISPASLNDSGREGIVRFPIEITVTKGQADLKTGMTANVEISCQRAANVLSVPNDSLFEKKGKWYVTVVKEEKKGKPVTADRGVTIGLANDARTEVRSGLKEGEKVQLGKSGIPERKKIDIRRESERKEES
jgi:RND family efflux transporter MFP subunit